MYFLTLLSVTRQTFGEGRMWDPQRDAAGSPYFLSVKAPAPMSTWAIVAPSSRSTYS